MFNNQGIDKTLTETLQYKMLDHQKNFIKIFSARYKEMLPSLIKYRNAATTSIDFLKMEVGLRNGYHMVVGETSKGNLQVLGWITETKSSEDVTNLFQTSRPLTGKSIHFIIPANLRLKSYTEISHEDDSESGNFVVVKNKLLNYISDMEILNHYTMQLAELEGSRFSMIIQSRVSTFLISENGENETITQISRDLYTGGIIKVDGNFDPEEHIKTIGNEHMAGNFVELKREYQNKVSELNNKLGINSLAVEKASGVSDEEAKGNRAFTTAVSNIFLDARNHPFGKLNKRYNLQIEAIYNDEVESEFSKVAYSAEGENS